MTVWPQVLEKMIKQGAISFPFLGYHKSFGLLAEVEQNCPWARQLADYQDLSQGPI